MSEIIVLGCGPSGLFVAQAVEATGNEPLIISKKKKSFIHGAQFLTKPIPGLTPMAAEANIHSIRLGTKERYAQRVYGESATPATWADSVEWDEPAWNLQTAYDKAWQKFEDKIIDMTVDSKDVWDMTAYYPVVISTIPQWAICHGPHCFESVNTLIVHKALLDDDFGIAENFVIYNGSEEDGWYRTSRVFGKELTETIGADRSHPLFSKNGSQPPYEDIVPEVGFKIVASDCDCHPNLTRAGRMGEWKRGVQTCHAYERAIAAIMGGD